MTQLIITFLFPVWIYLNARAVREIVEVSATIEENKRIRDAHNK